MAPGLFCFSQKLFAQWRKSRKSDLDNFNVAMVITILAVGIGYSQPFHPNIDASDWERIDPIRSLLETYPMATVILFLIRFHGYMHAIGTFV